MAYFQILGTGPSTPITDGTGRNQRRRSSALMNNIASYVLIDATHDFEEQATIALTVTDVVLTSSSRDAAGGLGTLDRWTDRPINLLAPKPLWAELKKKYGPFKNITHVNMKPHKAVEAGDLTITAFPLSDGTTEGASYGYRFDTKRKCVTYASDFKAIPDESADYFKDNDLLVVDGAGWDKDLPTHRGVLNHLTDYVSKRNAVLLFTNMGRSAPPHATASSAVRRVYHRADVAYDFMKVPLGR
jgi:phosphoribosyl 1,2-cyclic phosphodiesterase